MRNILLNIIIIVFIIMCYTVYFYLHLKCTYFMYCVQRELTVN